MWPWDTASRIPRRFSSCSSPGSRSCARPCPTERIECLVVRVRLDLAAEHPVADRRVDEHEGKDEKAFSPEHERETRMRCRGLIDGDRERDHIGPERDRERAECRRENERA